MKELTVIQKEKGTDNVTLQVVVTDVPEDWAELVEAINADADKQDKCYRNLIAALEGEAKAKCENGEKLTFDDLLGRSGRRTQKGLVEAIMGVMADVAQVAPALVADLVTLQTKVMSDYKGHASEYYAEYHRIYSEYKEASEAEETADA